MKGGYQIIDLTGLDLEVKASQTSITDAKVLKQLDYLKDYIEDDYNFSKALNNKLKPILLRVRDKKTNEKEEVSVWANLSKKIDNLHFYIEGVTDSNQFKSIQIEVVFELKQDEADNYYYGIKTAKYLLSNKFYAKGDIKTEGSVEASGNVKVGAKLTITGDVEVGASSNVKVFENIVDSNGNKRFIEGDILFNNPNLTMFTKYYGKWSLSGTHLTFVVAGKIDATYTSNVLSEVTIPEWIWNKIFPVGESIYIENKLIKIYSDDFTTSQEVSVSLRKRTSTGLIDIVFSGATIEVDRYFRAQFDLLIDNELIS